MHASDESGEPGEQVETIKEIANVKAVVNRQRLGTSQLSTIGEFEGKPEIVVTDFTEEGKAGFALEEGRLPEKENEVVVGSHFAEALYKQQVETSDGI